MYPNLVIMLYLGSPFTWDKVHVFSYMQFSGKWHLLWFNQTVVLFANWLSNTQPQITKSDVQKYTGMNIRLLDIAEHTQKLENRPLGLKGKHTL